MEYFELIQKRYSVRRFKEQDVPTEDLKKMIETAGNAPSGKNSQNWHFVAIKNKNIISKMAEAVEKNISDISSNLPEEKAEKFSKFSRFATFFIKAPVVIAVYAGEYMPEGYQELKQVNAKEEKLERLIKANPGIQSIGAAIENLLLAAFDMGYGGCWMTSPNHSGLEIEEAVGFRKEGYMLVALVPVGVPEGDRKSPPKKDIEEIMTVIE